MSCLGRLEKCCHSYCLLLRNVNRPQGFCLNSQQWRVRHNKTLKLRVESGCKICFIKSPSILIHIGPAVSFTLGWVTDVPGIIRRAWSTGLKVYFTKLCISKSHFLFRNALRKKNGIMWEKFRNY